MNAKKFLKMGVCACAAFVAIAAESAVEVGKVIIRQQWPWSTAVMVEYQLEGRTTPVNISIRAFDGESEFDNAKLMAATSGDVFGVNKSVGMLFIDPVKAFGSDKVAIENLKIKVAVEEADPSIVEPLYKVFDLTATDSTKACLDISKADLLNGKYGSFETDYSKICAGCKPTLDDVVVWTAVTNDPAYKTTKIVMRRVKAAGKTFTMGSPTTETGRGANESQHSVSFGSDYWIGVFPMTVAQYGKVKSGAHTVEAVAAGCTTDYVPAQEVYQADPRGTADFDPASATRHNVTETSPLGVLRKKFNADFQLPTEAQWEFAARAGVAAALYNGGELVNDYGGGGIEKLAWYDGNSKIDGTFYTFDVGRKLPNAFGLYDMLGGTPEWCLDWQGDYPTSAVTDYEGPQKGTATEHVFRGGMGRYSAKASRCAARNCMGWGWLYRCGFRLMLPGSLKF
ncbi:MAG: formylglycine-generating enzyme family protein [bacterium]|nr:formylglycine-generating enzyme family protein [Candidatus Colisoma equi]